MPLAASLSKATWSPHGHSTWSSGSRLSLPAIPRGGAWSLTGPYGSGKSSLALLLDAAFGGSRETRRIALKLVAESSPPAAGLVVQAHQRHGTQESGFHRGLVTANREPLSRTVLRALHTAVLHSHGRIPAVSRFAAASTLKAALDDAAGGDPRRNGPSPTALVEIARCLASDAPLLLIIDEFGKNLEAIGDGSGSDPYLLQQLAESGQGSGLPIFILTLQHLAFEDYLTGMEGTQRREWAKVQGRFEDVAFVESAAQTRALIGTAFEVVDRSLGARIDRWAKTRAQEMQGLGLADLADPAVVAGCYPLHPLAAFVLPELCSRYGQHERTLFSFLTGADRAGAASWMTQTAMPADGPLPSLGLEAVYDYFVANGSASVSTPGQSIRWLEIATRLRDAYGLTEPQARLAKAIALLNLVASNGTVRASKQVLALIDSDCAATLADLEACGVVTYREFADEYRIWQGTDVDIRGLLGTARQRVQRRPLVEILSGIDRPEPLVAARHSAEHGVLRVFARRYADNGEAVEPLDALSPYDGEVLLMVGDAGKNGEDTTVPSVARSGDGAKPVVVAVPDDVTELEAAAREVAAVTAVLADPAVADDWVAQREVGERLAGSRVALDHALVATFSSEACNWILLGSDNHVDLPAGRGSSAISAAADLAYPSTPTVRNEMLNRTALTSQGAKARRLLLEAMIEYGAVPDLGFDGYRPEMAMYRAFLGRTGLHGLDKRNDTMVFRSPADLSLRPAWGLLEDEFKRAKARRLNLGDVQAALQSPPIGMKAGAIPVFVTAGLLAFADEIAIYEHGTFTPMLSPEVSERMVRNPAHFDIKHFANTTGSRRQVVDALAERLGVRPSFRKHRVANVLAIVGHLVSRVSRLDNYTLRTANLPESTRAARDALVSAVEPDELLFVSLPQALGFRPVPSDAETYRDAAAYAERVGGVIDELAGCQQRLLAELLDFVVSESGETSRSALTGLAATLGGDLLDPAMRAFVLTLGNDAVDTDLDWIKAVATVVAKKAPGEWTDDDLNRFRREMTEQVASFHRLVALHSAQGSDGCGGSDGLRITVTRADGSEQARLVGVDAGLRSGLERILDGALGEMAELAGSPQRARRALLALLGERLLPARSSLNGHSDNGHSDNGHSGNGHVETPAERERRADRVEEGVLHG